MTKINMLKGKTKPAVKSRRRLILWIGVPLVLAAWGYGGYRAYSTFEPIESVSVFAVTALPPAEESSSGVFEKDEYVKRNAVAQDMYDLHNILYFDGRLPNAIVRFRELPGMYAETVAIGSKTPIIYVDSTFNVGHEQLGLNILHEMCHLAAPGNESGRGTIHGKGFTTCMLRLAKAGAFVPYW